MDNKTTNPTPQDDEAKRLIEANRNMFADMFCVPSRKSRKDRQK